MALEIAKQLDIDLISLDVSREFNSTVISKFCGDYMSGRTPNPCIICNPDIKFKNLLKAADEQGAFFIATGHYAAVIYDGGEGRYFVGKAANRKKDQSYMLYRLGQDALSRSIFPLGEFSSKEAVREYVSGKGIKNSDLKDSQEICFLPRGARYTEYLESRGFNGEKGDFLDVNNNVIGVHNGIFNYTVGQRKNLGMTFGKPMFVVKIDAENNSVTLGGGEDLFSASVVSKSNFFSGADCGEIPESYDGLSVCAKVRYASVPAEAVISRLDENTVRTVFKTPQRAATPGQSIVFYDGAKVIGGGVISSCSKT